MLTKEEKSILRILFHNKIYKADGHAFEDIFTSIMNYAEPDFRSIKPWGNIGDRKNDGYIESKGIFYQVFAPEEIRKSYPDVIRKLVNDFESLKKQWNNIKEFYFVVNDKFRGVNPDSQQAIIRIIKEQHLVNGGFKTAKDLENLLFTLDDDQITTIAGLIPDPLKIKTLNYSIMNEVIGHIMKVPLLKVEAPKIKLPDWDKKIAFNNLSQTTANYLDNGYIQVSNLEIYLSNNSNFLSDELRDKMNELYSEEEKHFAGDELFWKIVDKASPRAETIYQSAVIVIMSKYFESCDIFKEPKRGRI